MKNGKELKGTTFQIEVRQEDIDKGDQSCQDSALGIALCRDFPEEFLTLHELKLTSDFIAFNLYLWIENISNYDSDCRVVLIPDETVQKWIEDYEDDKNSVSPITINGKITNFRRTRPNLGAIEKEMYTETGIFHSRQVSVKELIGDGYDAYFVGKLT